MSLTVDYNNINYCFSFILKNLAPELFGTLRSRASVRNDYLNLSQNPDTPAMSAKSSKSARQRKRKNVSFSCLSFRFYQIILIPFFIISFTKGSFLFS